MRFNFLVATIASVAIFGTQAMANEIRLEKISDGYLRFSVCMYTSANIFFEDNNGREKAAVRDSLDLCQEEKDNFISHLLKHPDLIDKQKKEKISEAKAREIVEKQEVSKIVASLTKYLREQ